MNEKNLLDAAKSGDLELARKHLANEQIDINENDFFYNLIHCIQFFFSLMIFQINNN